MLLVNNAVWYEKRLKVMFQRWKVVVWLIDIQTGKIIKFECSGGHSR